MNIILVQYQPTIALGLLKGKMGGTVFQQGNKTAIIRLKGYRKGKPSAVRSAATINVATCTVFWRTLTPLQQAAWKTAATLWPFVNKFGVTYYGSAYQCFIAYNLNLLKVTPTPTANPNIPASPTNLGTMSVQLISSTQIILQWLTAGVPNDLINVYATVCVSPGRNINNAKFFYVQTYDVNGATQRDISDEYFANHPFLLSGMQVIFKVTVMSSIYPFQYFPSVFSAIVP